MVLADVLKQVQALEGQTARDVERVLRGSIALVGAEARCSEQFAAEQLAELVRRLAAAVRNTSPSERFDDVAIVCYVAPDMLDVQDPTAVVRVVGFGLGSTNVAATLVGGSTRAVGRQHIAQNPAGVSISIGALRRDPKGPLRPDSRQLVVSVGSRKLGVLLNPESTRHLCELRGPQSISTGDCWETVCTGWFTTGEKVRLELAGELRPENLGPAQNGGWSAEIEIKVNSHSIRTYNPRSIPSTYRLPVSAHRETVTVPADESVVLQLCVPRVDIWNSKEGGNLLADPSLRVSLVQAEADS